MTNLEVPGASPDDVHRTNVLLERIESKVGAVIEAQRVGFQSLRADIAALDARLAGRMTIVAAQPPKPAAEVESGS